MKKNEMTGLDFLLEAIGIVSTVIYIGLQIYYGVAYSVNMLNLIMNMLMLLLVYAGLTLFQVYPERVNGLSREVCSGKIRRYTIQMVRLVKLVFVGGLLFASICDAMGIQMNSGYSMIVVVLIVAVAIFYEYRIIKILREMHKK